MFFLWAGLVAGQPFSIGVKAGARLTDDLDSYYATSESRRYTVGPMATTALPFGFRVEFDALYSRVGYRSGSADILGGYYAERQRGNSWEFPIILQRKLWRGVYGGIGYAPRVINGSGNVGTIAVTTFNPLTFSYYEYDIPGSWETTHGLVTGAGIERRFGRLRIAPEVRYVRWNQPAVSVYGSRGFSIQSAQNQVNLMVGISFP